MILKDILNDLKSGDEARAETAVLCLDQLPEDEQCAAIQAFRELFGSPEVDQRWWATRALAEAPILQVDSLLLQALNDPDPSVRQCAALGWRAQIKRNPSYAANTNLLEELLPALLSRLNDPDALAARLAADALVAIGAPVVPQLLEYLEQGNPAARRLLVRALAEIGDPRAVPALFEALDQDSLWMEYWANEGLERMGVGMTYFFP